MSQITASHGALAVAALVGGGAIAFQAGRSIREGDIWKTDRYEKKPMTGGESAAVYVGSALSLYLTWEALAEVVKEVGIAPLALGSLGIVGAVAILRR